MLKQFISQDAFPHITGNKTFSKQNNEFQNSFVFQNLTGANYFAALNLIVPIIIKELDLSL